MKRLWIFGSGGHAKVVIDTALATGKFEVVGCLDDDPDYSGQLILGVPVVGEITEGMIDEHHIRHAVIGIGSNSLRQKISHRFNHLLQWETLIHPRAHVTTSANLGEGAMVAAGAIIQPAVTVGRHVICNTSSSIDHDSTVDDFAHIGPGAHLAGGTSVGEGSLLGIGSSMAPGAQVGDWSIVGAGAVVTRCVGDRQVAVGVPARLIREGDGATDLL